MSIWFYICVEQIYWWNKIQLEKLEKKLPGSGSVDLNFYYFLGLNLYLIFLMINFYFLNNIERTSLIFINRSRKVKIDPSVLTKQSSIFGE